MRLRRSRAATAVPTNVLRITEHAAVNAQRVGASIQDAANIYLDVVKTMVPDFQTIATLPKTAVGAMEEIQSVWIEWMGQTTFTGTQIAQDLLRHVAEQQRRFAAETVQGWMTHNVRVMQITMRVAEEGLRPFGNGFVAGSEHRRIAR